MAPENNSTNNNNNNNINNTRQVKKIESVISKYLSSNVKILNYDIKQLTAPGDNYGSVILAVDVTLQQPNKQLEILHLVAKTLPANELLCEMFNVQETFKIEIGMYLNVIPLISKFHEEYCQNGRRFSDLFAKSYGGRINLKPDSDYVDEDAVLFLENLKIPGYDIGDRLIGFDHDHVQRILEDLAMFHAVPIAFKMKKPEEFQKHIYPLIKGVKIADGFPEHLKKAAIEEILNVLKENKTCAPYLNKIHKIIESSLQGTTRLYESTEPFSTIIHTDYWVNNTMILKNEKGHPIKNKIVDFQMPGYNTGAMDLLFFLYSSVMPKILYKNIDNYIKFYYSCFTDCLKQFSIDLEPFSYDNFNKEIKRIAGIELGHILIMHKPIFTKRGAIDDMCNLDMDTMLKMNELSEDYEERIIKCVLSYIDHGWLD